MSELAPLHLGFSWGFETTQEIASLDIEPSVSGALEGPNTAIDQTSVDSYTFDLEISRTITTSDDPGFSGMWSDLMLGGGIEIVYDLSDEVYVAAKGKCRCVETKAIFVWHPAKSTTFLMSYWDMEAAITQVDMLHKLLEKENTQTLNGKKKGGPKFSKKQWAGIFQDKKALWEHLLLEFLPQKHYHQDETNNPHFFDKPNLPKLTKPVSLLSASSRLSRQLSNMLIYSKTSLMNGHEEDLGQLAAMW